MRTYGEVWLAADPVWEGHWAIKAEPHIMLRLKRVFERVSKGDYGTAHLANTPENCRDLLWFIQRYPLDVVDLKELKRGARRHRQKIARLEDILGGRYRPTRNTLAIPLRDYQTQAVELYLTKRSLLVGDDVGLGKTAVAIGSFADPRTLPAVVVTLTFLPQQWEDEIHRFAPALRTHIVTKGTPYELPQFFGAGPDVLILNYHKLYGWPGYLARYAKSIVFDEVQELRRVESLKYKAAKHIAAAASFRLGLSATPIYNYGGEIFNVVDVLSPGELGTREEFNREWTTGYYDKPRIREPRAFGTYLRENFVMLRRTRKDVGRELPALTRAPHTIGSDARELHKIQDSAVELAKIILRRTGSTREERFEASGRFDMIMRQATGIAKAPYVADFVRMLVDSGERVILCGWHRAVYEVWESRLRDLEPAWFTGTESVTAKARSKDAFVAGDTPLLFMSLRAGGGVDGFQECCRTMVFGELDWSPGIHEQCVGRIHRDGQTDPVVAYFLIAEDGADPIIADTLGIKRGQIEGIRDPGRPLIEKLDRGGANVRRLAEIYLDNAGQGAGATVLAGQEGKR